MRAFSIPALTLAAAMAFGALTGAAQPLQKATAKESPTLANTKVAFAPGQVQKLPGRYMKMNPRALGKVKRERPDSPFKRTPSTPDARRLLAPQAAPAQLSESATMGVIYGAGSLSTSMYQVELTGSFLPQSLNVSAAYFGSGLVACGDIFYGSYLYISGGQIYLDSSGAYTIDPTNGYAVTPIADADLLQVYDGYYDAGTGLIYASMYFVTEGDWTDVDQIGWGTIDPLTGQATMIREDATSDPTLFGVFGNGADTWGIDEFGTLYSIDRATGERTKIVDNPDLAAYYLCGGSYDPRGNVLLYLPATDDPTVLWQIDPATGAAEMVHTFAADYEIIGFSVDAPAAEDGAPARVDNVTLTFEGDNLTGTVGFTAPTETYAGQPLSGELSYTVSTGNTTLASGTCQAGDAVTANVAVPASGTYSFTIVTANEVGNSPRVTTDAMFIGKDVPRAPGSPTASWADGTFTITWTASPATGVGGKEINVNAIVYQVKMLTTGEVKTTAAGATSMEWKYAEPLEMERIAFEITPIITGDAGTPATTNTVMVGAVIPPYENSLTTQELFNEFTSVSGANAREWQFYNGWARVQYNSRVDMDSYLISPPIKMSAGSFYDISAQIACYSRTYPETAQIVVATGNDLAAMQAGTPVGDKVTTSTLYNAAAGDILGGTFECETAGTYYVAIHGCSEMDTYYLYAKDFKISGAINPNAPMAVSNLTATPDMAGGNTVKLNFTAPKFTVGGDLLSGITSASIVRDGETLTSLVMTGASMTWTDNNAPNGNVSYVVYAYNNAGVSVGASASCFVGLSIPANVDESTLTMKEEPVGTALLNWTPVTQDVNGKPLNDVTYDVIDLYTGNVVGQGVQPPFSYKVAEEGEQNFAAFAVLATASTGESTVPAYTATLAMGTPYETPFVESFAGGNLSGIVGLNPLNQEGEILASADPFIDGYGVLIASDATFVDLTSSDSDDGFFAALWDSFYAMFGMMPALQLDFGLITIPADMKNPSFAIDYYGLDPSVEDTYTLKVREAGKAEWTDLATFYAAGNEEWVTYNAPLNAYLGKTIQVAVAFEMVSTINILFDNVRVYSQPDYDIANPAVTAPEAVMAGESFSATVDYVNAGAKALAAADYTIELYVDGNLVKTAQGVDVAANAKAAVTFDEIPTSPVASQAVLTAKAVLEADENPDNNEAPECIVLLTFSDLPTVSDLVAVREGNSATLTWTAPEAKTFATELQDFADATPGTQDIPEWTNLDLDAMPVGGFTNVDIPGIEVGVSNAGWVVVEQSTLDLIGNLTTHSGSNCVISMFVYDGSTANDDWLISPELPGVAQTISFFARSYSASYPEHINVLYSTTDNQPESFEVLKDYELPNAWTQYAVQLPEGTKYFAIQCDSYDCFMAMLDDISYKGNEEEELTLQGYDVYRDGEKLNSALVSGTTYVDNNVDNAEHTYVLLTQWAEGVSRPSNEAKLDAFSGIDAIEEVRSDALYYNLQGQRIGTPMAGQVVIRVAGQSAAKVLIK